MSTIVLVHGAFAESASWNGVITRLHEHDLNVIAAANPLRDLPGDADVVAGVISSSTARSSWSAIPTVVRSSLTPSVATTGSRRWCTWPGSRLRRARASPS
ncbi:hypothetical protein [Thermocatellispora tengchongensis]|uniref:hypothetical protein n=1 Tax=Thermocatellispora tengchongensis TaxID=1073253 RepID=UPI00362FACDE